MIKYITKITALLAVFIVLSCTLTVDNSPEKGYICLSIPPLIPDYNPADPANFPAALPTDQPQGKQIRQLSIDAALSAPPRTRAYGFITRLEIILRNSGGAIVESWEFEWDSDQPWKSIAADEGTGYTLEAIIYNEIASTSPTATGVSEPFDVTAENWMMVQVTCLPVQTTVANPDTLYSYGSIPTHYDYTTYKAVHYGGECWYSITALYDVTAFEITPEPGNHAFLKVFDLNGESIGLIPQYAFLYKPEGSSCMFLSQTNIGETYYIVTCPVTPDGDFYSTVDFKYFQGPDDDTYEENDDYASATPILPDNELSGLLLDEDYFQFTVESTKGLTVTFDISIMNTALYRTYIYIEDSEKNMIVFTEFDNCIHYRPVQPLTVTVSEEGTYYFILFPSLQGAGYTASWNYE